MDTQDKTQQPTEELKTEVKLPQQLTDIIIRHEDEIREVANEVHNIAAFIRKVDVGKSAGPLSKLFFKYIDDKVYVIIGVVAIAVISLFVLTDPTNILMSVISGLFGMGTGRAMSNKDD